MTIKEIRALYYAADSIKSAREAMIEIDGVIDSLCEEDAVQAKGYMEGLAMIAWSEVG